MGENSIDDALLLLLEKKQLEEQKPKATKPPALPPPSPKATKPPAPPPTPRKARSSTIPPVSFGENTQVGHFGLIREIARGGMGQVFLARDTRLGRKVAIKFLLDNSASFVSRFLIEARATALCTHENIVTIYEVGQHKGLPFMVLEYLTGKTLTELLEQPMAPRPFAELIVSVVRALERAHEHGIVHRDLKPNNIFVTDRGVVKVLDFGVAKLFGSPAEKVDVLELVKGVKNAPPDERDVIDPATYVTFTGNGQAVGTLSYMSPEQWGTGEVDHASDLWACGILLWRGLTGKHPAGTSDPVKLYERMVVNGAPMPSIAEVEPALPRELVAIVDKCLAMTKQARYASATELLADLQAFLMPAAAAVRGATAEEVSPYRGLASFGESDSRYFFGRSGEIRSALAQLDAWPLLAVIGPSGVGKSSFVHAGLVPALRGSTAGRAWSVKLLRPGRSPIASLGDVLAESLDAVTANKVMGQLPDAPGLFGEALRRSAARDGRRLLIVVDQLEELFTLSDDAAARATFLSALLGAADDPSSPVRVVLSMRADFLDRLAGDRNFLAELSRGMFFLSAPDRDNLRETLVRPAELAGYAFEDDSIVEHIVQTATSRGALPLLQFAATKLWDARDRKRKTFTRASYDAMGGIAGAFARHADDVAAAVPPQHQALLRAILTRLVTSDGTRAVVDRAELLSLADHEGDAARILDQLVRGRLVHVHTDSDKAATVEIVHEALISEWPTLKRWLEDSSAVRAFLHDLRHAAKKWASSGRPAELVWRGAPAREAQSMTERHVLDLAANERAFLAEIQKQASSGRRRRVFALSSLILVLVVVILFALVTVWRVSNAERVANQRAEYAATEAERAKRAEAEAAARLAALEEEARKRKAAEAEAAAKGALIVTEEQKRAQAEAEKVNAQLAAQDAEQAARRIARDAKSSREDQEVTTAELENAVTTLEADRRTLERELERVRREFEELRQQNARTQAQLESERRKVRELEQEQGGGGEATP